MPSKKLYAFNRDQASVLSRMAGSYALQALGGTSASGDWTPAGRFGGWIMQATSDITACDFGNQDSTDPDIHPGEGTAKIKQLQNDYLEDFLSHATAVVERDIKSLIPQVVPSGGVLLGLRTQDGQLWAVEWLDRPYGSYVAKTGSTAISARSGTTPGEGYVDLYKLNLDIGSTGYGELEVYREDVHVYSWVSVESGTNSWCYVGYDVFGVLWFENEDCGALYA